MAVPPVLVSRRIFLGIKKARSVVYGQKVNAVFSNAVDKSVAADNNLSNVFDS
jgi:hypothetical protein